MSEEYDAYFDHMSSREYDREEEAKAIPAVEAPKPKSRGRRAVEGALDTAITAADAATLGLSRPVAGGLGFIAGFPGGTPMESAREAYGATDAALTEAREGIPGPLRFGADVLGATKGIPGLIDNAVDAATKKLAPTGMDILKKLGLGTALTAPMTISENYLRGDMDLGEAIVAGGADALIGAGAQAAIGEKFIPLLERAYRNQVGKTGLGEAVDALTSSPLGQDTAPGFTIADLYDLANNKLPIEATGRGLLDIGDAATREQTAIRAHDALADLHFGQLDPRKASTADFQAAVRAHEDTLESVTKLVDKANDEAVTSLGNVVTPWVTAPPKVDSPKKAAAKAILGDIGRTKPNPDGSMPIGATNVDDTKGFVADTLERLENKVGLDFDEFGDTETKVWNTFSRMLRKKELQQFGGAVQNVPVTSTAIKQGEEFFEDVPLARLYSVRKEMADLLTPQGRISGDPLTRKQRLAVMSIIESLDGKLDDMTNGKAGTGRGLFAEAMREENARELGYQFYSQRQQRVESKDFADHYNESFDDFWNNMSDGMKDQFKRGFSEAMMSDAGERSIHAELTNFIGDPASRNVLKQKTAGQEQLKKIYGDEGYKRIESILTESDALINARAGLEDLLIRKGATPDMIKAALGDAGTIPPLFENSKQDGAIMAALAKLKKAVKTGDADKIEAMQRLLLATDAELQDMLERGVREAAPGESATIGSRVGAIAAQPEEEEKDLAPEYNILDELTK